MNKILCNNLVFDDKGEGNGKLLDGSFFVENSLAEDELSIDTLEFSVRYPLTGQVDTSPTKFPYGTPCTYYQNEKLFGKFYLVKVERLSRFEYNFKFQSAVGLLNDTTHYGGIYQGEKADVIISDIIGGKIPYTIKEIFSKIKLYGWLPIATRRENLKQVLFACGGTIKKNDSGDVYITTLDTTTPIDIPDSRVFNGGKMSYDTLVSRVEVTEHGYIKSDDTEATKVFEGELSGQNFTTPKGYNVRNAALVTWDKPYHSLTFEGCSVLNDEYGVNYAIVTATPNAVIMGKPYIHTEAIIYKNKSNYTGEEKVATVEDATLVSLANSGSTAERVLAYYGNSNTLSTSIILDNEKPTNTITVTDPFGDKATGFIKNIDGTFGSQYERGDVDIVLNYKPPTVVGSRTLVSISVTTPPTQVDYASGDYFNTDGMVVTATYDDGSTNVLNSFSYTPNRPLKDSDTQITITYTEMGVTASTIQNISVVTLLRRIAITTPPDNTAYYEEDVFDTTGMVVTAYYSDGSSKILNVGEYTYYPTGELTKNDETITITYTDTGVTATTYQDITVGNAPNLTGISITKNPNKMSYKLGQFFDATGMVVTASFDNGKSKQVNGYTYSPAGALGQNDTTITVSYTKGGITKTTTLTIVVVYLTSIAVTTPPTYTEYYEGDSFNKYGMVVTAYYNDSSSAIIGDTSYSVTPDPLPYAQSSVTITYTEQGITATTTQAITVTYYPYDYTNSIVISSSGTYTLSGIGATHKNIRVVCLQGGTGGNGGSAGEAGKNGNGCSASSGSSNYGSAGNGGAGGKGGTAGGPGKVYSEDIYIPSLTQSITINCGSSGSAGSSNGGNGSAGGHSTFSSGCISISSASGAVPSSGYKDLFTETIYSLKGIDGKAGANGGNGGSPTSSTTVSGNAGSNVTGYTGGSGGSGSYSTGGSAVKSWTEKNGGYSSSGSIAVGSTYSGYTSKSFDRSTGTWSLSGYTTVTVQKTSPGKTVYELKGSGSSQYCQYMYSGSSHVSGDTTVPKVIGRYTKSANYDVAYGKGYGGGGGSGASYNSNGNAGSGSTGGAGVNGTTPSNQTNFGSGGHGGNGGSGGGGGGGSFIETASYATSSYSVSGGSGGSGGNGSAGGLAGQGAVIIYYS